MTELEVSISACL